MYPIKRVISLILIVVPVFVWGSAGASERINANFSIAADFIEFKQYSSAEELLDGIDQNALDAKQRSVLFYLRGVSRLNQDKYAQALSDFDAVSTDLLNPVSLAYYRGNAYMETGEFEKAAIQYTEYAANQPENAAAHQALGHALALSGDLVRARESLTTSLQLDPGNDLTLVYLARVAYQSDSPDEAASIARLTTHNNNQSDRDELAQAINMAGADSQEVDRFGGFVSFGLNSNDNVIGLADGSPTPAGIDDEGDSTVNLGLGLHWRAYNKDGQLLQLGYRADMNKYSDLDQFDTVEHVFSGIYSRWLNQSLLGGVVASYSMLNLDSEDFLDRLSMQFIVRKNLGNNRRAGAYYSYSDNDYQSPILVGARDRDSTGHSLGGFHSHEVGAWKLDQGLALTHSDADGSDFGSQGIAAQLAANRHLTDVNLAGRSLPLEFSAYLSYSKYDYDNANSIGGVERSDDIWQSGAALMLEIDDTWSAKLALSHSNNESNIDFYNYDRTQLGLTVRANF